RRRLRARRPARRRGRVPPQARRPRPDPGGGAGGRARRRRAVPDRGAPARDARDAAAAPRGAARDAHRPRARRAAAAGRRPHQRRDRRRAVARRRDRQDPRGQRAGQAGRARPDAGRDLRLRVRLQRRRLRPLARSPDRVSRLAPRRDGAVLRAAKAGAMDTDVTTPPTTDPSLAVRVRRAARWTTLGALLAGVGGATALVAGLTGHVATSREAHPSITPTMGLPYPLVAVLRGAAGLLVSLGLVRLRALVGAIGRDGTVRRGPAQTSTAVGAAGVAALALAAVCGA